MEAGADREMAGPRLDSSPPPPLPDMFPKHQLFYIVGGFYAIAFSIIAACLAHPVWGVENTESSPYRLLGWISYCTIESFGSIGVSLFW